MPLHFFRVKIRRTCQSVANAAKVRPMSIPLKIIEEDGVPNEDARRRQRRSVAGLKVLLAEDVEMVRDLITVVLSREQIEVTAVNDGAAAVAAATTQAFDILLLDVEMPVMGGLEATKRIRDSGGGAAIVPILALTSNVSKRDVARCQAAGMDGHVSKPFSPENLINAIKAAIFDR